MSTVENAASLFGSDEAESDPFGAVLGNEDSTAAADQVPNDYFGKASGENLVASDLFQATDTLGAYAVQEWHGLDTSGSTQPTNSGATSYDTQGWQDQGGQWQDYSQVVNSASPGYEQYTQPGRHASTTNHNPYAPAGTLSTTHDPYAPVGNVSTPYSVAQSNASYAPPATNSKSSYAPYAPPNPYTTTTTSQYSAASNSQYQPNSTFQYQPSSTSQYQPSTALSGQGYTATPVTSPPTGAYDPYKPASTRSASQAYTPSSQGFAAAQAYTPAQSYSPSQSYTPAQTYTSSQPSAGFSSQPPHTSAPAAIPPPPKPAGPTADAFRPKKLNAYDPPIPTGRSKRAASGFTRMTSPSASQPPLPPPPATRSTFISPPPSRQYASPSPPVSAGHYEPMTPVDSHALPAPPTAPPTAPPPSQRTTSSTWGQYHEAQPSAHSQLAPPVGESEDRRSSEQLSPSLYDPFATSSDPEGSILSDVLHKDVPSAEAGGHANGSTAAAESALVLETISSSPPAYPNVEPYADVQEQTSSINKDLWGSTADDPEASALFTNSGDKGFDDVVDAANRPQPAYQPVASDEPSVVPGNPPYLYGQTTMYPSNTSAQFPPTVSPRRSLDVQHANGSAYQPLRSSLYDPYAPPATTVTSNQGYTSPPLAPPPTSTYDPYRPDASFTSGVTQRSASPTPMSVRSSLDGQQRKDLYAPPQASSYVVPPTSYTNGLGYHSDPYAPSNPARRVTSETSDYGDYPAYEPSVPTAQEVTLAPHTHTPYAPSPTLLGSNDPLGRVAGRAPVFSFGFGGKLVTCFHGSGNLNTGFDVALSARQTTDIHISLLHNIIPESALELSEIAFPGPLFNDPGTPTAASLVRSGAAQTKTKKAKVTKYLEERTEELTRGLGYFTAGSVEKHHAEGKLVLAQLLKVMVEQDGRLSGSAQAEAGVRAALVPHISAEIADDAISSIPNIYGLSAPTVEINETPLATYVVKESSLDKITDFLIRGERRKAYNYALDQKLWAHAMVIASSVDKEAWKDVVNEFVRAELGRSDQVGQVNALQPPVTQAPSSGREPLRVAYNFFAGQGASAVQELVPPHMLLQANQINGPTLHHFTPMSPNFPQADLTTRVPTDALSKWTETAAMLFANPMTPDSSAALVALGDYLLSNQWTEAAHACYLLSGQTSLIGGARNPSVRIVLLGSESPHLRTNFYLDQDSVIFSEILEFALALTAPVKGQETFSGFAHLQAYKLVRASMLAEAGHMKAASRYCEAIAASIGRNSPFIHPMFIENLQALADRLVAAPQLGKASWIGGKMAKPSLDGIGSWLEGRLTKFIAGEGEDSPSTTAQASISQATYGPFSHYSAISSAAPSTTSSPQPSVINTHSLANVTQPPPPRRSGSAMAVRSTTQAPVDRASSAMDIRHRASPVARSSASATAASFHGTPGYSLPYSPYSPALGTSVDTTALNPSSQGNGQADNDLNQSWWGGAGESTSATPTAPTFMRIGEDTPTTDSGATFISLMDEPTTYPGHRPTSPRTARQSASSADQEDEEDLGFGNSSRSKKQMSLEVDKTSSPTSEKPEQPSQDSKASLDAQPTQAASGSWFGRWFKRGDATPGPVKASLGEESSFYYDKELKRWVNKKAGDDAPKQVAPPPPPSRAQTASPQSSRPLAPTGATPPPPPTRPASSADMSGPPRKATPRIRSNLVPTGTEAVPGTPPPSGSLDVPPTPGRPRSQASKRNVRSRYVDVFQSGPNTPS